MSHQHRLALVTGGAGFIGSNLVRALLSTGTRVRVIDDLSSGYRDNLEGLAIEFVEADITDPASVVRAMEGVSDVFHLAASVGNKRSIDDPVRDAAINVMGTTFLLEAARTSGVRRFVVSSSAGIFGELVTMPIAEDHPLEPDTPYGATKLCQEKQCLAYGKLYELDVVAIRYFNIYGPRQRYDEYGNVIPIFAFRMLRGQGITIFGDGEQTRDFLNVRDVVQANLKAASVENASGAYNLGSGGRVSINRLVELLQEASGIKANVTYAAERPGDVRDSMADITLARNKLGFEPTVELEEGLREYVDWAAHEVRR